MAGSNATSWDSTKHTRGARLLTGLRKGGLRIDDFTAFLAKANEARLSPSTQVRIEESSLSESGQRTYTISASEDYHPPLTGFDIEWAAGDRIRAPYGDEVGIVVELRGQRHVDYPSGAKKIRPVLGVRWIDDPRDDRTDDEIPVVDVIDDGTWICIPAYEAGSES